MFSLLSYLWLNAKFMTYLFEFDKLFAPFFAECTWEQRHYSRPICTSKPDNSWPRQLLSAFDFVFPYCSLRVSLLKPTECYLYIILLYTINYLNLDCLSFVILITIVIIHDCKQLVHSIYTAHLCYPFVCSMNCYFCWMQNQINSNSIQCTDAYILVLDIDLE